MKQLKSFIYCVLIALCNSVVFTSCNQDAPKDRKDWSEVINLYVDAELGEYRPWGHPEDAEPLDGLKIKEDKDAEWEIISMDGIEGFTHSLGWEFCLEVEKRHLANPPADASNIKYKLIKIVEEKKARTPEFPTLEIKGAFVNSYKTNIFEPVHFYLQGNDYMLQDLRELCDSLVFDIPWLKGSRLSRKIYSNENGITELTSGWDHRFILPMGGICNIKAYKDGNVVYQNGVSVSLTNDKDFLMYNWDEITESMNRSIGYVNFVDEKHEFLSTHYVVGETPIAKVSLSNPTDDTVGWLYEYLRKFYKEPLYNSDSCVQEQYKELFTDIDDRETPLYIWQTESSLIVLIHWYDSDEDITQYYIKAETVK